MAQSSRYKLLVANAAEIVQVTAKRERFVKGTQMDKLAIIKNGSMVINQAGKIEAIGKHDDIISKYGSCTFDRILDLEGSRSIVPGLVDAHTHPVWSGDRVHEFAMKLKGATYMDIHKAGGGIGYTVKCVRNASEDELLRLFLSRLDRMLSNGTTLVEAKSGYGLNIDSEIKMLKVIQVASDLHSVDIVANYCGAHSVIKSETTVAKATKDIIDKQIPKIIELKKIGIINPQQIDVFHEKGIFEMEETKSILKAGVAAGLSINFHGDELHPNSSAELAAELNATAVSHLECISDKGIKAMAESNVVGVLLPTTAHILQITDPPARKMINSDVIVALGSDFNPNAHCLSLPFVMNLACVKMRLSLNEALCAATINAAAALNKADEYGSLEVGKFGDFLVIDDNDWRHLIYELVDPPMRLVFKKGQAVFQKQNGVIKVSKL